MDKPILFSGPMVEAILEGQKTMTRRIVKPQPDDIRKSPFAPYGIEDIHGRTIKARYLPGDILWVRETWRRAKENLPDGIEYKADKLLRWFDGNEPQEARDATSKLPRGDKWRPSIFMPRWASRITLEVTAVRVERLQEITEEDAMREGIERDERDTWKDYLDPDSVYVGAQGSFKSLWDSINGKKYPWKDNPWVWCIEFKKEEQI